MCIFLPLFVFNFYVRFRFTTVVFLVGHVGPTYHDRYESLVIVTHTMVKVLVGEERCWSPSNYLQHPSWLVFG